ncbi:TOBE domain-containing protein [Roseivivax sp. GX 12232]|nr:TOBE domain-containing protein [Roseivivax sp. GX 12232]
MNQLEGRVEGGAFILGPDRIAIDRTMFRDDLADGPAVLGIRPEYIQIGRGPLQATVRLAENTGHETILTLELSEGSRITARVEAGSRHKVGQVLSLGLQNDAVHLFEPGENGARLNKEQTGAAVIPMRAQ